ncbi:low molecular weight protein-tyrosine-phosphatase [Rhodalgimonas zhirmunskyi]|uniref:protein-tyrosine-phosphatase n=1 Tax=Rhodalgimonas zhirmunskyi TaxID=2964767 RepID=A0AAJ1X636_9RHOB|nr:low molecular weight protein-tyrosine-phosphatase [Rhodoalgimonas zhirmunskyi]MDQ2094774.1 low molecular weight phosphotyrosine protein phosphatase [Rhodoalgimonas zhirmunskyi]
MKVLFVCLGNICRSPAAEGVFRTLAGGAHEIDSAGTSDWHVGEPPYGPMQAAAGARGIDLSPLRARQFEAGDFTRFDLIIGMDAANIAAIERLRPDGAATPVRLFTDYAQGRGSEVPDPYYTRDFDGALDLIEACAEGLLRDLGA